MADVIWDYGAGGSGGGFRKKVGKLYRRAKRAVTRAARRVRARVFGGR